MNILRKRPGQAWEVISVENTLEALQQEVGGYIETCTVANYALIICNEDGRLLGLEPTGFMNFVGTILFVGIDGEEFTDAPECLLDETSRARML